MKILPERLCVHAFSHACMQIFIFSFRNDGNSLLVLLIPLSLKLDYFSLTYDGKSRECKFCPLPPTLINRRFFFNPINRVLSLLFYDLRIYIKTTKSSRLQILLYFSFIFVCFIFFLNLAI